MGAVYYLNVNEVYLKCYPNLNIEFMCILYMLYTCGLEVTYHNTFTNCVLCVPYTLTASTTELLVRFSTLLILQS